jgi:hypothetical protein
MSRKCSSEILESSIEVSTDKTVGSQFTVTRYLLRLSGATLRNLVLVITCHGNFRKHLHGLAEDPVCLVCELEEETVFHIVCECPALSIARTREFGKPLLNERKTFQAIVSRIQGVPPVEF